MVVLPSKPVGEGGLSAAFQDDVVVSRRSRLAVPIRPEVAIPVVCDLPRVVKRLAESGARTGGSVPRGVG